MADPISIIASVITIVGATKKTIQRLKILRGAPQGLEDLLSEITQFDIFLHAFRRRPCSDDADSNDLKRYLRDAEKKLTDFNKLLEYTLTKAGTSNEVDRWQWTRKGDEIQRVREDLRETRANLVALSGVETQ